MAEAVKIEPGKSYRLTNGSVIHLMDYDANDNSWLADDHEWYWERDFIGDVLVAEPVEDKVEEDEVNHPSHYNQYPVEVILLTEHMPFLAGNVVKYVTRSPFKGTELQDLRKAQWYLNRLIANLEAEDETLAGHQ